MKALFVNVSSIGHVVPTLNLIHALAVAGVDVVYLERETHRQELEAAGARVTPMAPFAPYTGPETATNAALPAVLAHCALEGVEQVLAAIEAETPDVVVHDSLCFWGRLAADLAKVPRVNSIVTAALTRQMLRQNAIVRRWLGSPNSHKPIQTFIQTCYSGLHSRYGCPREDLYGPIMNAAPANLVYLTRSLQPCADQFGTDYLFCGVGQPMRFHAQPFDWSCLDRRPLVYMSFGTVHDPGLALYQRIALAFARVDAQLVVVATASLATASVTWPPRTVVCAQGSAPQLSLLAHAAVFISHGGGGAIREAAWSATPVLAWPMTFEQDLLSLQLARQGAAIRMSHTASVVAITAALQALLHNRNFVTAARRLRAQQQRCASRRDAVQTIMRARAR